MQDSTMLTLKMLLNEIVYVTKYINEMCCTLAIHGFKKL